MAPPSGVPHVFGLTGGIGSGKSTVARLISEEGVPVVDADQLARQVVAPQGPALSQLQRQFGSEILTSEGNLDRGALASIVFSDPGARARLESIVHPLVGQAAEAEFQRLAKEGHELVCYEIPLLFETEQAHRYRPVVVVHVPFEAQIVRTVARDGMSEEEARSRIEAQLDLGDKAQRADYVIDNTGTLEETKKQALNVLSKIRKETSRSK